jgi:electron transfer flavoprotein beta subunit
MKILVCVSNVPDTTSKIAFTDNNTKFSTDGVQWVLNPYDEWFALVRALELKEAQGGSVTVINVGGPENDAVIRKALAIGADDAIRVNAEGKGPYYVASQIATAAKEGAYDIIFTGKETINYNGSNIGGMVAELLGLPFVSYASKLDMNGNTATMEREIEGGKEVVEVDIPFVVSAAKGMAEQRIPNMRGIMMAKSKPLKVVEASPADVLREILHYELPAPKSAVKLISPDNPAELVDLLYNEAKIL